MSSLPEAKKNDERLRRHEGVAREYERLKQQLMAEIHPHDHASREAYARGKTEFVERIVAIAVVKPGNGLALM